MKYTPEHIGRKIIFKNVLISLSIIFLLPLLMVFIMNMGSENNLEYLTFYKNVFKSISISPVSMVLQILALLIVMYFVGGITGRKVINDQINPYKGAFISLNILWFCFFVIAMINEIIIAVFKHGLSSEVVRGVVIPWIMYGLILFIFISLIYSAILSIFISNEFKKAIKKEKHAL